MAAPARVIAQVRLENPCRADRQKVLINNRLGGDPTALNQRLRVVAGIDLLTVGFPNRRQAIAEIGQPLMAQQHVAVGKRPEHLLQMELMGQVIAATARLAQQFVIQRPALRGQRNTALFDFAKTGGMGAVMLAVKHNRLFQRFKAGLAQQDGDLPARRAFDNHLRFDTVFRHQRLNAVDVQRARRQVVDVTAAKRHHIGNQPMCLVQRLIGFAIDGGMAVPAEGFQRFPDKLFRLFVIQPALRITDIQQFAAARRENIPGGENTGGFLAQFLILDQFEAQQRGKHAKRVALQRGIVDGAERCGVHRYARLRKIVIAHRIHAQHREHPAQRG